MLVWEDITGAPPTTERARSKILLKREIAYKPLKKLDSRKKIPWICLPFPVTFLPTALETLPPVLENLQSFDGP
jgi:hypothetical protein